MNALSLDELTGKCMKLDREAVQGLGLGRPYTLGGHTNFLIHCLLGLQVDEGDDIICCQNWDTSETDMG